MIRCTNNHDRTRSHDKTVLIIRNAYAFDFGGGERFPVVLAEELKKQGYNPVVISGSAKLLKFAQSKNINTIQGWWWSRQNFSGSSIVLFPAYFIWQILLFFKYLQLILYFQAQIVHPQSRDDFIAATFAAKLLRRRVIWTDHADLKYIWQNLNVWYKNPVGKLVYIASKLADHITLVSFSEKNLIEEQLRHQLPAKFSVIYNGVTETPKVSVLRKPEDKDAVIFVTTSRLVTAKGFSELIQAFNKLSRIVDVRLWIIGEGPEENTFKKMAEANSGVTFMGFLNDPLGYVATADIFMQPSYHEGFSISLVEAAMLAKPIIACNVGGNPEIVIDSTNGLLVPARDSDALYTAMKHLAMSEELRTQYGKEGRKIYEKDFIFEKIVKERFIPLYEK
jgi:glycosyltransferase involved in cell wall biosynthesis